MPISLVSVSDDSEDKKKKQKKLALVSVSDDAPSPTPTPKPEPRPVVESKINFPPEPPKPEYFHPLNANPELQKYGLSASMPAQRPQMPGLVDTRKTSFGAGLDTSIAGTTRQAGFLGAYAPADVGPSAPYEPERQQMQDTNYAKADRVAAAIEPSLEEVELATQGLAGKVAFGAGYMSGELPKYIGATGLARAGFSAIPSLASRPLASMMAADVLGSSAVDATRDPLALGTPEGIKQFGANQLGNLLQGPLGRYKMLPRALGGAAIGAGTELALGGNVEDAAAGALMQGTMGGIFGSGENRRLSDDLLNPINAKRSTPEYQANLAKAETLVGQKKPIELTNVADDAEAPLAQQGQADPITQDPAPNIKSNADDAREFIKASESGAVLNANPLDYVGAYATILNEKLALKANQANDALGARVPENFSKHWVDVATSLNRIDRVLGTPYGQGLHAEFYTKQNLAHRIELALKSNHPDENGNPSLAMVTRDAAKMDVLPEAKRVKQIDHEIEQYNIWQEERAAVLDELEALAMQRDTPGDVPSSVPDQGNPSATREKRITELNEELRDLGENFEFSNQITMEEKKAHRLNYLAEAADPSRSGDLPEYKPLKTTVDDVIAEREKLLSTMDPKARTAVDKYGKDLTGYYKRLLDLQVEAGLVSREAADEMTAKRPGYVPLYRAIKFMESADADRGLTTPMQVKMSQAMVERRAQSANPTMRKRNAGGSSLELADPTEAAIYYTAQTMRMIDNNTVRTRVADLHENNLMRESIRKTNPAVPVYDKATEDIFTVMRDGKMEAYVAPKAVVDVIAGSSASNADHITQMMAKSANMLRSGATSMFLPFVMRNMARDYGTAVFREGIWNPVTYMRAAVSVLKQDASFERFVNSGSTMSGFTGSFRDLSGIRQQVEQVPFNPLRFGDTPNQTGGRFLTDEGSGLNLEIPALGSFLSGEESGGPRMNTVETAADLLKLVRDSFMIGPEAIANISEFGENIPRKAMFDEGERRGQSAMEAAYRARNVTVDFRKMGESMRRVNMVVPFLNARAQGLENTRQTYMTNPGKAAARTVAAGVVPAMMVALWNYSEYPDVAEQIGDNDANKNLVFIWGREKDPITGQFRQWTKIPKAEPLAPIMNMVERYVKYLHTNEPIEFGKMFTQMVSDGSPVSFARGGEFSGNEVASGVLPPIVKAGYEVVSNKNTYADRDIDTPEELKADPYKRKRIDTPMPAAWLGDRMNWSPNQIENFIGTTTAGAGRQALQLGDLAMRSYMGDKQGMKASLDRMKQISMNSLVGGYPKLPNNDIVQGVSEKEREVANKKQDAKLEAERIIQGVKELPAEQQPGAVVDRIVNEYADHPDLDRIVSQTEKLMERHEEIRDENTARAIFSKLQAIPAGAREEEIAKLAESGTASPAVIDSLLKLNSGRVVANYRLRGYLSRISKEAKVEYVVERMNAVSTDEELLKELENLKTLGILTAPVEREAAKRLSTPVSQ